MSIPTVNRSSVLQSSLFRSCSRTYFFFFFSSRRRHTRCSRDWSSDVCSSDLEEVVVYIHHGAALLPILLTLMRREMSHCTFHSTYHESHLLGACLAFCLTFA